MASFKVTAPQAGFEGRSAGVMFREGVAIIDRDTADRQHRKALQYFTNNGYSVQEITPDGVPLFRDEDGAYTVDEDGQRVPYVETGDPVPGDEPPPRPPLPADSAPKPEWLEAAEVRGYTREQADAMTKPELIAALKAIDNPQAGGEQK